MSNLFWCIDRRRGLKLTAGVDKKADLARHSEVLEIDAAVPSPDTLGDWVYDGVAEATDGCRVELDGVCPHGCPSWLLLLGYI